MGLGGRHERLDHEATAGTQQARHGGDTGGLCVGRGQVEERVEAHEHDGERSIGHLGHGGGHVALDECEAVRAGLGPQALELSGQHAQSRRHDGVDVELRLATHGVVRDASVGVHLRTVGQVLPAVIAAEQHRLHGRAGILHVEIGMPRGRSEQARYLAGDPDVAKLRVALEGRSDGVGELGDGVNLHAGASPASAVDAGYVVAGARVDADDVAG